MFGGAFENVFKFFTNINFKQVFHNSNGVWKKFESCQTRLSEKINECNSKIRILLYNWDVFFFCDFPVVWNSKTDVYQFKIKESQSLS